MLFPSLNVTNWLKRSIGLVLISALPFLLSYRPDTSSKPQWGFFAHKRVNRIAVFTLPPQMFGFYKDNIEFLTEHSVDPDKRRYAITGEAECHYIDLDHYYKQGEDPYSIMPKYWKDAVAKYTEDTLRSYGIVPWHILNVKYKLQKAFETKNIDLILKYSADIGHYIGDAHVPLHTTENYNGQLTGQKGIHALWESRLVEINAENYDYFVGKAAYQKDVQAFCWQAIKGSHSALDSVFRMEKELTNSFPEDRKYSFEQRGNTTVLTYSREFCELYHQHMNGMVERRLKASIIAVGSIWYSCWVDAGQPDLRELQQIKPSAEMLKEFEALDEHFHNDKHFGRICD
ncbi:MAG: S1/P1 Nuclease [Bacteroidetes bacterium]|nr:S1/P1 Nuclease [Bacteroidota bacterium]MBM3424537.1 S1/P1 Nuclease [Bacteroidota bacterium]